MARPKGAENKDKPFREALRVEIAAAQDENDFRSLRKIARGLLTAASEGKIDAIREIADRMDGKPAQESIVDVTTTKYVARIPAKAKATETWQQQHSPQTLQ